MTHKFKIICEVCGKSTYSGILVMDNGGRLRLFCSNKCLKEKINEQEIKLRKRIPLLKMFFKSH